MDGLIETLDHVPIIWIGLLGSLVAGLGTGVGALAVFVFKRMSARIEDGMLGFAAGIMLAATFFSLILPGLEVAETRHGAGAIAVLVMMLGLLLGAVVLWAVHRYVPHEHFISGREGPILASDLRRVWLFIIAITLHNFPEGMAVGVGFGDHDLANGLALTIGIGLQNLPEGLAVAASLAAIGYSRASAFGIALITGLVEPVGGLFGASAVTVSAALLPWALAFSAGAMLFVISDEIIPETHRRGFEDTATFALMVGFVLMMFLDYTLG